MNKLEKMLSESQSGADYAGRYVSYLSELLAGLDLRAVEEVIEAFQNARSTGKTIFFVGNGGSAATCSHFAEDLAYGGGVEGREEPFRALSLTDNAAYMTAVGNDEGYENVFVAQLRNLFGAGDVLVVISGSGNSPNVVKAVEYANSRGGVTVGIVGFDGGRVKEMCTHCIQVKAMKGEYGPVEDIHLVLAHLISAYSRFEPRRSSR